MAQWAFVFLLGVVAVSVANGKYKGTYIGQFSNLHHAVGGHVYAIDNITMYIEGFNYDGEAPDAFFFAGNNTPEPSNRGFIIPNERGNKEVLGPYRNKNMVIKFPKTKKGQRSLNDVQWVSIWCRQFAIDFGNVKIPRDLKKPEPQVTEGLHSDSPVVRSSSVAVIDTNTFRIDDFTFDATVPDAIFVMGSGDVEASGTQVPDEKGTLNPLRKYSKRTIFLSIPAEVQGQPIQYLGVWSPTGGMMSSVTFDPKALVPPALKTLL